jgi:hypothetical protein
VKLRVAFEREASRRWFLCYPCTNETRCGFAKSAVRLAELKQRVERARQQAVASVNANWSFQDSSQRQWYASKAIEHGWSRQVLLMQIETNAHARSGAALTNFDVRLPPPQSALARDALKNPYIFNFLGLAEDAQERDIEQALTRHITRVLFRHLYLDR